MGLFTLVWHSTNTSNIQYLFVIFHISASIRIQYTFPLFQTCRYKVVSPATYATKIRMHGQSFSVACFDQHSDEKPKVEMKTKPNCAPDGSVMLANKLFGVEL